MENKIMLNNFSEIEEFERSILNAQIMHITNEIEAIKNALNSHDEIDRKLYQALSKRLGCTIDHTTIHDSKIPYKIFLESIDEVFSHPQDLIRPSHNFLPYSLIRKQPQLKEFIPVQNPSNPLEQLHDKATSRAYEIVEENTSQNTIKAHHGDLIYWQAWLSAVGFSFYHPISEKEILTFAIQHAEGLEPHIDETLCKQGYKQKLGPHRLATIKRRIASLSVFLENTHLPNPCHNKDIKNLLSSLTKKYGRKTRKAITRDILDEMLDTCGDKLIDRRDKALLLFAWSSGGRRRSEVAQADLKDLQRIPDGDFLYIIPQSKTDQEKKGYPVPVKGRAARALQDWLTASGITQGAIFRSVNKKGKPGDKLSAFDVYRIVHRRLKKAGYSKEEIKDYGAHSLRSGFVTEAGRKNKPLGDVMALTTHRNVGTVMRYYQAGNITNNSAANLAD